VLLAATVLDLVEDGIETTGQAVAVIDAERVVALLRPVYER
jgi:hypothetical protein